MEATADAAAVTECDVALRFSDGPFTGPMERRVVPACFFTDIEVSCECFRCSSVSSARCDLHDSQSSFRLSFRNAEVRSLSSDPGITLHLPPFPPCAHRPIGGAHHVFGVALYMILHRGEEHAGGANKERAKSGRRNA